MANTQLFVCVVQLPLTVTSRTFWLHPDCILKYWNASYLSRARGSMGRRRTMMGPRRKLRKARRGEKSQWQVESSEESQRSGYQWREGLWGRSWVSKAMQGRKDWPQAFCRHDMRSQEEWIFLNGFGFFWFLFLFCKLLEICFVLQTTRNSSNSFAI